MDEKHSEEQADSTRGRPYQRPVLRRLGSVADITRATGSANFMGMQSQDNLPEWMRPKS